MGWGREVKRGGEGRGKEGRETDHNRNFLFQALDSTNTPGLVSAVTSDCLQVGKPSQYVISHPRQLSLLPSVGR